MEAKYFETRLLAEAVLAPYSEGKGLQEAMENYVDAMFPFMRKQRASREEQAKKCMDQWTGHKVLKVTPLYRASDHKRFTSRLKKGEERIKQQENARKMVEHRRLK
jgi:hypothetical protein